MNLVIFDFCDTLTNFQSADAFCRYTLHKKKNFTILFFDKIFFKFKIYSLFSKLSVLDGFQKKLLLRGLKGLSESDIDTYAQSFHTDIVEKGLNPSIVSLMNKHIASGDYVVINSGGFMPYLKIFARQYSCKKVYATEFEYNNQYFTGRIRGKDCLNVEKVKRMKDDGLFENIFKEVIVYSDSITDIPLFDIATKRYVNIYSSDVPNWCADEKYEIIKLQK